MWLRFRHVARRRPDRRYSAGKSCSGWDAGGHSELPRNVGRPGCRLGHSQYCLVAAKVRFFESHLARFCSWPFHSTFSVASVYNYARIATYSQGIFPPVYNLPMALQSLRISGMKQNIERVAGQMSAIERNMKTLGQQISVLEQKLLADKAKGDKDIAEEEATGKEISETRREIGRHAKPAFPVATAGRAPSIKQSLDREQKQIQVDKNEVATLQQKIRREEQEVRQMAQDLAKAETADKAEAEAKRKEQGESAKGRSKVVALESRKRAGESRIFQDKMLLKREEGSTARLRTELSRMQGDFNRLKGQKDGYEADLVQIGREETLKAKDKDKDKDGDQYRERV